MAKLSKTYLWLFVAVGLALIGLVFFMAYNTKTNDMSLPGADNNTVASDGTKFEGPTEQELKDTEQHKEDLANSDKQTDQTRQITPTITSASVDGVRGFVAGVAEDGGTCTVRYTKGTFSFDRESTGVMNASTTVCPVVTTTAGDFTPGTWTVTLIYSSSSASGSSAPSTIEVK